MSDDSYGATIAKRRLARQLTAARLKTGYTANHACDILNWGRGKVGRFEANQWKRPEMSDIRDLIRIYGIEGDDKEEIEDLAIRARARPWWREVPEIFDGDFPGYDNDPTPIRVFIPLVLPALLHVPTPPPPLPRSPPPPPPSPRPALTTPYVYGLALRKEVSARGSPSAHAARAGAVPAMRVASRPRPDGSAGPPCGAASGPRGARPSSAGPPAPRSWRT